MFQHMQKIEQGKEQGKQKQLDGMENQTEEDIYKNLLHLSKERKKYVCHIIGQKL